MYKKTSIIVLYENKTNGESYNVVSQGTDAEGNQTFVIEHKYKVTNQANKKNKITLTERYEITRKKPYVDSTDYRYYYIKQFSAIQNDLYSKTNTEHIIWVDFKQNVRRVPNNGTQH
mgnify:CR=1 FL=1